MTTIDMMTLISLFLNLILVFTSRQHNVGHLHRKKVGENKIVLMWSIYTQMGVILDVLARSGNNIFCQNCFKLFQNKLFFQNKLRHSDSGNKAVRKSKQTLTLFLFICNFLFICSMIFTQNQRNLKKIWIDLELILRKVLSVKTF